MTWRFVIEGRPVSQKNAKKIGVNRKTGKRFPLSRKNVLDYKGAAILQLRSQWNQMHGYGSREPITRYLEASGIVFQGGGQAIDLGNSLEAVFDSLEKAKIIKNDYQIAAYGRWRRLRDPDRPRIEITLTPMERVHE